MHTLYESDTTKHSGIPGPLEGSSFNRKVSVAWNVTQQSFIHYMTMSSGSENLKTHKKAGIKAVKAYFRYLNLPSLAAFHIDLFNNDPQVPPPDNSWRNNTFHLDILNTHTHTVDGVCCLPEPICCAGLRPGPASHHNLCLAAVPAHNTSTQWHFLSLLFHLHGHFSVSVHWFSTTHSHTHSHILHMRTLGTDSHIQRPYVCHHTDKHRLLAALQALHHIPW